MVVPKDDCAKVEWVVQQKELVRKKRSFTPTPAPPTDGPTTVNSQTFPDPLYSQQWYLNGGAEDGMDMNVGPAWARGYTGKGVVVSILDDGIQTNHPDLIDNYC
ncbi:hypothetical protein AAG570_009702 [Ranatra chinensis]|uniref:Peptidase S8/S53 domain-containing protein n=1 Tax=Ranatra chinensis TaxID=642074 RepID=A0ABD0Z2U0_9HEMI